MSRPVVRDFGRWMAGELDVAELERAHPGVGFEELADLHHRLAALAAVPVSDPEAGWERVRHGLGPQLAPRRSLRARRGIVAGAIAAIVAGPGIAYAVAPEAVRDAISDVVDALVPGGDTPTPGVPPSEPDARVVTTTSQSPPVSSTTSTADPESELDGPDVDEPGGVPEAPEAPEPPEAEEAPEGGE